MTDEEGALRLRKAFVEGYQSGWNDCNYRYGARVYDEDEAWECSDVYQELKKAPKDPAS